VLVELKRRNQFDRLTEALNRVNLGDPVMDLSSTNFGRSTSQLAPRAFQIGVRLRF
jgi:hypothetical protein